MNDLPPLPVSRLAIEIALNGFSMGYLCPHVWAALLKPRNSILDLIVMLVWSVAFGLFWSNLWIWITRT